MEQARDCEYYDLLGLEKSSTPAQIRKAYYNKARTSHPDKNPDNPRAEEEFKLVSEAYSVLSDENKRELYDKFGKAGIRQDGGGEDPTVIIKSMFGGDKFQDCWGNLMFLSLISEYDPDGTSPEVDNLQQRWEEMQQENKKNLVKILTTKLQSFLENNMNETEELKKDIQEKFEAPGGPTLLSIVGEIYITKSRQYIGRFFGLQGYFESWSEKGRFVGHFIKAVGTAVALQKMKAEFEASGEAIKPDDQAKMAAHSLNAMWTFGKIEIDRLVNAICEEVLTEKNLAPEEVKKRAIGIEKIGQMYLDASQNVVSENNNKEMNLRKDPHPAVI